jgi:hypothetical protein
MSTPLFLLASLGLGLGLAGLSLLIGRCVEPSVSGLHRLWLERRLRRRLARGDDASFEELRSIDAAMKPMPARLPKSTADRVLLGVMFILFGLVTLTWFLPEDARPFWTRKAPELIFVVIGLQWASGMSGTVDNPRRGMRIVGVVMIVMGSLMFAYDLYRLQRVGS